MKLLHSAAPSPVRVASSETTKTHCPSCALRCGMAVTVHDMGGGELAAAELSVRPDVEFPVNRGQLCIKGFTTSSMLDDSLRIRAPKLRLASGRLGAVKWDVALDFVADKLRTIRERHGAQALAALGSGALTNEKAYLIDKLMRVALRSTRVSCEGHFGLIPAAGAQHLAFGLDRGLPFPVTDLGETKALMLWGTAGVEAMPPLMQWIGEHKSRGGQLIVVDPRRTDTARAATLHMQCTAGTELALANGLLHLAVQERLVDLAYIAERTEGFEAARRSVLGINPAHIASLTGVSVAQQLLAVRALAAAESSIALSDRGADDLGPAHDTALALINLMLALGKVGKPASGYGCLTVPQDNAKSTLELLDALDPQSTVRALLAFGPSSCSASAPEHARKLAELELLVVCDAFESELSAAAHVVLPTAHWAEEEGTMTNLAGRVTVRRAVRPVPPGVKTDSDVICALGSRLGHRADFGFVAPRDVFEELRRETSAARVDYRGMSYEKLRLQQGVFWPCPSTEHPGTPRLFTERFAHPSGLARFHAVAHRAALEMPDAEYPLLFTTGRCKQPQQQPARPRRARPNESKPEPRVQMHPSLADRLGLQDGQSVLVESRRGAVRLKALISSDIRPDTLFAPFHWGGRQSAHILTRAQLEAASPVPDFKMCPVRARALDRVQRPDA